MGYWLKLRKSFSSFGRLNLFPPDGLKHLLNTFRGNGWLWCKGDGWAAQTLSVAEEHFSEPPHLSLHSHRLLYLQENVHDGPLNPRIDIRQAGRLWVTPENRTRYDRTKITQNQVVWRLLHLGLFALRSRMTGYLCAFAHSQSPQRSSIWYHVWLASYRSSCNTQSWDCLLTALNMEVASWGC